MMNPGESKCALNLPQCERRGHREHHRASLLGHDPGPDRRLNSASGAQVNAVINIASILAATRCHSETVWYGDQNN